MAINITAEEVELMLGLAAGSVLISFDPSETPSLVVTTGRDLTTGEQVQVQNLIDERRPDRAAFRTRP